MHSGVFADVHLSHYENLGNVNYNLSQLTDYPVWIIPLVHIL